VFLKQFLACPERHRHLEGAQASRGEGQIRLQETLEFQKRLVVKDDVIDVLKTYPAFGQTVCHGVVGEARVVLLAAEALLLGSGHNIAIANKSGCAVMIK